MTEELVIPLSRGRIVLMIFGTLLSWQLARGSCWRATTARW
ncbi:MAG: hypothetical protein ACJ8GN_31585 [Longimicrobiaceae bacterium]